MKPFHQTSSFLALGDSYTIAESVPLFESFPYQTVQLLRKAGIKLQAPEIIAKTGWTTDELADAISKIHFNDKYDIVSLLIGVNNQYRGRSVEEYAKEFEELAKQALAFTGNKPEHVFVLSIPDWGCTPFAKDHDREKISDEINRFNVVNKAITLQLGAHYLEITEEGRESLTDSSLVAADGLHPSAKEYLKWATKLSKAITDQYEY